MAQILKVLHLAQQHGVAQVQVGRGGVEAGLDAQRRAGLCGLDQALAQILFADDFRHAFLEICELFVDRTRGHSSIVKGITGGPSKKGGLPTQDHMEVIYNISI